MAVATSKSLELQHAREGIGHRTVVVYDEDGFDRGLGQRALGGGNHRIILKPKEFGVKLPSSALCYH